MILMVLNHPKQHVIDKIDEAIIIDDLYFVNKKGEVFKSDVPFDTVAKFYGASRVFLPLTDSLTKYQKVEAKGSVEKEQEVCKAKSVVCVKNKETEIVVIHPQLEAYLCNDDGKTINKI